MPIFEAIVNELKAWWYLIVSLAFLTVALIFGDLIVGAMNKVVKFIFGGSKN